MRAVTDLLPRWGQFALAGAGVLGLAITCPASAAQADATSLCANVMAPAAGQRPGKRR